MTSVCMGLYEMACDCMSSHDCSASRGRVGRTYAAEADVYDCSQVTATILHTGSQLLSVLYAIPRSHSFWLANVAAIRSAGLRPLRNTLLPTHVFYSGFPHGTSLT